MNSTTNQNHAKNESIVPTMTADKDGIKLTLDGIEDPASIDCSPFDNKDLVIAYANEQHMTTTGAEQNGPNQPHPALEYPLFYHALKVSPCILEGIKVPYAHRWRLSYPLQRKVTCSRTLLQFGVHLTWGELLLLVPFFLAIFLGILYTAVYPSVSVTGKVARYALIAAFVLAQRNSLVTLLVGMPVDRILFYHKLSGKLAGAIGLLHTLAFFVDPTFRRIHQADRFGGAWTGQVNTAGSVMMLMVVGIVISSLPSVRVRFFEIFYYLHLTFATGLVAGAFFHTGKLVPILALVTWGVDLFIRKALMAWTRYPKQATIKILSSTVIEVSFPKTSSFAYNPGQYIYLSIPEISWLQWHPFSISSSPSQPTVKLHIRRVGNWTSALYQLATKKSEVEMLLEGPYGSLSVDIMGDRKYHSIMLISGGIGIAPMQSVCDQILQEQASGQRELRHLKFIWIERDPILLQEVSSRHVAFDAKVELGKDTDRYDQAEHNLPGNLTARLLSLIPPEETTETELEEQYADGGLPHNKDDQAMKYEVENPPCAECPPCDSYAEVRNTTCAECRPLDRDAETLSADALHEPGTAEKKKSYAQVLDMQVYLTGDVPSHGGLPFVRFGRPDIQALFEEMKKEAFASGNRKVAVCVCAPQKLTNLCRRACVLYSDDEVRFDFHSEVVS